jgi:PAS domain-containing protein
MNSNGTARCKEIGVFLRSRRLRLTPEVVGLPNGTRRRINGLRREEVAYLADIGITWYTWLEQGRPIAIASETLERLACALRLNAIESVYLSNLVRTHKSGPGRWTDAVPAYVGNLLRGTDAPACVLNPRHDLLEWNESHEAVYGFANGKGLQRNAVWRLFTDSAYQGCFGNWSQAARDLVRTFRSRYAEYVGEPLFESLIEDLHATSKPFQRIWSEIEIASSPTSFVDTIDKNGNRTSYEIVSLSIPEAAGQTVAFHVHARSRAC